MIDSDYKKRIGVRSKIYRTESTKDFILVRVVDSGDILKKVYEFSAIFIDEGITRGHFSYTTHMLHKDNHCKFPFFWISTKAKIRGLKREELHTINDISPWDNIVLIDSKNITKNNKMSKDAYLPTSVIKQKNKPIKIGRAHV